MKKKLPKKIYANGGYTENQLLTQGALKAGATQGLNSAIPGLGTASNIIDQASSSINKDQYGRYNSTLSQIADNGLNPFAKINAISTGNVGDIANSFTGGFATKLAPKLFGESQGDKNYNQARKEANYNQRILDQNNTDSFYATNPNFKTGIKDKQFYESGGEINSDNTIPSKKNRKNLPLIVNNINDPNLVAYRDSTSLSSSNPIFKEHDAGAYDRLSQLNEAFPKKVNGNYIKPVQEVKYKTLPNLDKISLNINSLNKVSFIPNKVNENSGIDITIPSKTLFNRNATAKDVDKYYEEGYNPNYNHAWVKPQQTIKVNKNNIEKLFEIEPSLKALYPKGKNPYLDKFALGGNLNRLSNNNIEINGPSHEEGGVNINPTTQVEGGETISNNFVFSEELGFAQRHKPIAKAIGNIEKKPQTRFTIASLKRLKDREENLKVEQEQTKQQLGIPSDLDHMRYGGKTIYAYGGNPILDEFNATTKYNPYNNSPYTGVPGINRMQSLGVNTNPIQPQLPSILNKIPISESNNKFNPDLNQVTPYLSNIFNATQKLPKVPNPILNRSINLAPIDLSAQKVEADRQRVLANKMMSQTSNVANANANMAQNLATTIGQKNQINNAEYNANVDLRNKSALINSEINNQNNRLLDNYNNENVNRTINQQQRNSSNISDFSNKVQLSNRDNSLMNLERDRIVASSSMYSDSGVLNRNLLDVTVKQLKDNGASKEEIENYIKNAEKEERLRKARVDKLSVSTKKYGGKISSMKKLC